MWPLFLWVWIIGAGGAAVLFEVARAESARVARAGRIAFAVWVSLLLLGVAVAFGTQNALQGNGLSTRSGWWALVIFGGVPVSLLCGLGMLKAYRGRRLWLAGGVLLSAALYVAFPLGYEPPRRRLHGLARFEHLHHALDVVALLTPALVLLAGELREPRDPRPDHLRD
jgi:hypothetical protein